VVPDAGHNDPDLVFGPKVIDEAVSFIVDADSS
jgi:hypothetical protein